MLVESLSGVARQSRPGQSRAGSASDAAAAAEATTQRAANEKQNSRERVVLLMHETSVLTASDATLLLLLLAREVRLDVSSFVVKLPLMDRDVSPPRGAVFRFVLRVVLKTLCRSGCGML